MEKILIGKYVNTHGIKGEIRIKSNFKYKNKVFVSGMKIIINDQEFIINSYRVHQGYDMITLKGINNINDIIGLKGSLVYINKDFIGLNDDEYLAIYIRSSIGTKYMVRMCNQVGIIDADYYNNIDNEGHIWIKLQNHGDKDYIIKKGDAFAQGIIMKYLVCDDDNSLGDRIGGIGSTDRRDNNG